MKIDINDFNALQLCVSPRRTSKYGQLISLAKNSQLGLRGGRGLMCGSLMIIERPSRSASNALARNQAS